MIPLISFLLPTRGRPELVKRFINSAKILADYPELFEIILYIDEDDSSPPIQSNCKNLKIIYGPRTSMGKCNSRCLAEAIGEIIVLANDDVVLKTKGWDTEIRKIHEKYPDGIYLAYPNDLFKKKRGAAFPILSRKTCAILAQPFPSIYKGSFIDTHILDIFIRLKFLGLNRIHYLEGVIFEHLHFRNGKSKIDETYLNRDRWGDDMAFLALAKMRNLSATDLLRSIHAAQHWPVDFKLPPIELMPTTVIKGLQTYIKLCLFDVGLPWGVKIKNFIYYFGRWGWKNLFN